MTSCAALTEQYAALAGVRFCASRELYPELGGDLPLLVIENAFSRTVLSLYGAHLLSFVPNGRSDLLWLSPKAVLEEGKPIRGGIPLCLPWFSEHPQGHPMHGFARISNWSLEEIDLLDDGRTRIALTLEDSESSRMMWPHEFLFRLELVLGAELMMSLTVENRSESDAQLSFAFHTYFNVGDVARTTVSGLDDCPYLDKPDGMQMKMQEGDVDIAAYTDSVYYHVPQTQTIHSPQGEIGIAADNDCAVVWNAWERDVNMADMGAGNAKGYLCVERGEVFERAFVLPAGGSYRSSMTLS